MRPFNRLVTSLERVMLATPSPMELSAIKLAAQEELHKADGFDAVIYNALKFNMAYSDTYLIYIDGDLVTITTRKGPIKFTI